MLTGVLRLAVVLLAFGGFVAISEHAGVPAKLPSAAFGWNLLFHLERAAAVLATGGIVLLVGCGAMHGEFPMSSDRWSTRKSRPRRRWR